VPAASSLTAVNASSHTLKRAYAPSQYCSVFFLTQAPDEIGSTENHQTFDMPVAWENGKRDEPGARPTGEGEGKSPSGKKQRCHVTVTRVVLFRRLSRAGTDEGKGGGWIPFFNIQRMPVPRHGDDDPRGRVVPVTVLCLYGWGFSSRWWWRGQWSCQFCLATELRPP
jgi:hypothetical protein